VCDEVAPPPGQRAASSQDTQPSRGAQADTRHRSQTYTTEVSQRHLPNMYRNASDIITRFQHVRPPLMALRGAGRLPHDKSLFLYTPYRCAHVIVHAIHRRKGPIQDHRGARLTREAATRCRSTMKLERPARPPPRHSHARFCHGAATCSCTIGLGLRRGRDLNLNLNLNLRVPLDSAYAEPTTRCCEPTLTTIVRLPEVSAPSGRLQDPRVPHREARMSSSVEMRVCCRVSRRR
jgi:hypothetical protein